MALYQLKKTQFIRASLDEVWDFISSPRNLKEITPVYMGFEIVSDNLPDNMYPGMLIHYKVRPFLGIPLNWVSEITHIAENKYFIDVQRTGPYSFWHHQHFIEQQEEGILMTDIVSYTPPFSFLGYISNAIFIRKQLNEIFSYREAALNKRFPYNRGN